ncbi:RNA recognition motif domain-containing protein [Ditylenchus destructor]|nr:RNA recognition motif domain-containing protein [Ditylenchus destructor]
MIHNGGENGTKSAECSPSASSTTATGLKNPLASPPISSADDDPNTTTTMTTATGGATSSSRMSSSNMDDCPSNANLEESGDESNQSNDPGKMFIGGLSWQTSAENLRDYFCKFGDVNECMVMRDPATKRARGFGFITFADPNSVDKVLADEVHELDGKRIDPKVAFPKRTQPKMVIKTKKVFIGGLASTSTLEDMKIYFQQYGKIEDAMLMFDKSTQRHRGFGFITFDDDDVSDKVCEIHFHEINGKMVECKKAQPKEVMLPVQLNKSRAAAARNLYGLAPEQLLAYASYIPRLPPYNNTGVLYPAIFNGFSQSAFGMSPSGRSSASNNGPVSSGSATSGLINPRDLAAVQLAAQQQAVYDAALAYANTMSGGDFNAFHAHNMAGASSSHHSHQQPHMHGFSPAHHQQHHPHQNIPSMSNSFNNSNKM